VAEETMLAARLELARPCERGILSSSLRSVRQEYLPRVSCGPPWSCRGCLITRRALHGADPHEHMNAPLHLLCAPRETAKCLS